MVSIDESIPASRSLLPTPNSRIVNRDPLRHGGIVRILSDGYWRRIAMPSASVTSSVPMWSAIDQPTIRRENASSTAAQYTLPSSVGGSVMTMTQKAVRLGYREVAFDQ